MLHVLEVEGRGSLWAASGMCAQHPSNFLEYTMRYPPYMPFSTRIAPIRAIPPMAVWKHDFRNVKLRPIDLMVHLGRIRAERAMRY